MSKFLKGLIQLKNTVSGTLNDETPCKKFAAFRNSSISYCIFIHNHTNIVHAYLLNRNYFCKFCYSQQITCTSIDHFFGTRNLQFQQSIDTQNLQLLVAIWMCRYKFIEYYLNANEYKGKNISNFLFQQAA